MNRTGEGVQQANCPDSLQLPVPWHAEGQTQGSVLTTRLRGPGLPWERGGTTQTWGRPKPVYFSISNILAITKINSTEGGRRSLYSEAKDSATKW